MIYMLRLRKSDCYLLGISISCAHFFPMTFRSICYNPQVYSNAIVKWHLSKVKRLALKFVSMHTSSWYECTQETSQLDCTLNNSSKAAQMTHNKSKMTHVQ